MNAPKLFKGSRRSFSQRDTDQPLRILFCGSDEFSITSLEALHRYASSSDSNVASIDVATKTDKRTGRGLKVIKSPPIKSIAEKLGLAVHQFDTFRGWSLPASSVSGQAYINMVIAVSFGLLVPPRILAACEFGGLNVHPSMLPDLKGSTPIEHAIINGYDTTGVTVQTLHPSKFDEGRIVLQTPFPGIRIPDSTHITTPGLRNFLAPIGAEMLIRSLHERLYLRAQDTISNANEPKLNHAPKMSPESRHISFRTMSSTHVLRLNRALGRLWFRSGNIGARQDDERLMLESDLRLAEGKDLEHVTETTREKAVTGLPFAVTVPRLNSSNSPPTLLVKCVDGELLCIPTLRMSSSRPANSVIAAARANLLECADSIAEDQTVCNFHRMPG